MKRGDLIVDGWAGKSSTAVEIIRETAVRIEIRAIECTKLAGRDRWLDIGQTTLVPRSAIRNIRTAGA